MRAATIARDTAVGIVGGLAASAAMNGFQAAWSAVQQRLEPEQDDGGDEPSTVKAADRVTKATAGEPVPEPKRQAAGEMVHYGFGAVLGGLYGAARSIDSRVSAGFGMPFGAAVWAVADEAAVPALGLSGPPAETAPSTHLYSLLSHLLFGAVLEGTQRGVEAGLDRAAGPPRQQD